MFMANEDEAAGYGRICREENHGTLASRLLWIGVRAGSLSKMKQARRIFDLTGMLGDGVRFLRGGDHEINRDFGLRFHRLPVLQVRLELPLPEHFARGGCEHRRSAHHAQIFDFAVSAD